MTQMPAIAGRGVVNRYSHVTAIRGASFEVLPGEIVVVVDDNGQGRAHSSGSLRALLGPIGTRSLIGASEMPLTRRPLFSSIPRAARCSNQRAIVEALTKGTASGSSARCLRKGSSHTTRS